MDQNWVNYKNEMQRYVRFLPLAPLIALIPFLFNLEYWREHGGILVGMGLSLIYGTLIGLTINLFFAAFFAALTWIRIRTGKFYQPPMLIGILLGSFGAIIGIWVVAEVKGLWQNNAEEGPPFLPMLIFSGMITTGFALYFAYRRAKEEALALRAESAESRYQILENQMRPHFLFNALNSLAELIESGRADAAETTYKLADLYRQILANSDQKTASLRSEIAIVRAYLELEQLRFGSRLRFEIRVPEESDQIFLPSLMLQTLVENAVKHGIAPSVEGGKIWIDIARKDRDFRVTVANTGVQLAAPWIEGTGLANTKARLDLLYGNLQEFSMQTNEVAHTCVSFSFSGHHIK